MPSGEWKTVKEVLFAALELDAEERKQFLSNSEISPEVRAEVESLLLNEPEVDGFMTVTASGFTRELLVDLATAESSHVHQRFGPYETVAEIGFGGMGVVYLANRVDGKFEQTVAIKMLKREFNTAKLREIFRREKEILAALSHPNIAALFDAGTTDDGIPYLVMEYVDGRPIDEFCDTQNLSLESRLKLYNKVCDTVSRAHRSLVVHRDLKPSNILVTAEGEPKLLDFGISKLLDVDNQHTGAVTQFSAMTPQYASPEQLNGASVTTATDVYSLGVILFKILTGSLPRSLDELNSRKFDASPTLPSEVAKRTALKAAIAPSAFRGDLDNIVLKALRQEPERRYLSVEQLSSDIWRFIDGLPVLARPSTLSYRASKFFGRHKVPVLAASLVVASLIVGIGVAVSQARAAREQARIAREQRDAAQLAKERSERTSKFMQSFFDYANPDWYGRGKGRKDVTVKEAIDDAAGRIDTELSDQLEVRADLHYTIAVVYLTQGSSDSKYLEHARRSLELYRQALGENHPKVARALYYLAIAMDNNGATLKDSISTLEQGIAIMRRSDPNNVNLPYMLQTQIHWITSHDYKLRTREHFERANNMAKEATALFIQHYGENGAPTLTMRKSMSLIALNSCDLDQAERLLAEDLKTFSTPEKKSNLPWVLYYLGRLRILQNRHTEAEALFIESTNEGRALWGENSERSGKLAESIQRTRTEKCGY